ncbi:MAG: BMP family ABC transporter substrate-binding protein [Malacoplasma sp.]|nr:BMP family ABC transporter substrate-binding protein [Malacoplasma sp.]MDE7088027.1 BMP family ABC transporter substrate-binding protein [Malacoplasma sp.]
MGRINRKSWYKVGTLVAATCFSAVFVSSCSSYLTYESSVQLIVSDNTSTLADKSFSESAYDGIRDFLKYATGSELPDAKLVRENNGLWKRPGDDDDSRLTSYKYAVTNGSKLIVATGYNQQDALQKMTSDSKQYEEWKNFFEDTGFVFVDGAMANDYGGYKSNPNNVASVSFRADDGSFLAGIATAVFLNVNKDYFKESSNGKLGVSSYVGLALDSTLSYMSGFRLGIHYWNTVLHPLIKDTELVYWVTPNVSKNESEAWDIGNFVSGSFSATEPKVEQITKSMRSNGANVIFPIAGPQTTLTVNQIASNMNADGQAKTVVIGVDTAQENDPSLSKTRLDGLGKDVGNGQVLQFSSVKNITHSTNSILQSIVNDQNDNSSYGWDATGMKVNSSTDKGSDTWYGLGWNNVGTLNNGSVGVSDAGLKYVIDPFFWLNDSNKPNDATFENPKTLSSDWSNTDLNKDSVTLNDILSNDKYHAKELVATDSVISSYAKLLQGYVKTPATINSVQIGQTGTSSNNEKGLNGWDGNGSWWIHNNSDGRNNFLLIKLSSCLHEITSEPTAWPTSYYTVASNEPAWVGGQVPTKINLTKQDMFYKKN